MGPVNPLYLSTFLDVGADWSEQSEEFAIVSGYATTGEKLSAEQISRQMLSLIHI